MMDWSETGTRLVPRLARFSDFSIPVAAPAYQAMDTQLNALPILAVCARIVSGCLNSAFLGLFYTSCGPSSQAMDTQLDALATLPVLARTACLRINEGRVFAMISNRLPSALQTVWR